jgi:hypothetical protein
LVLGGNPSSSNVKRCPPATGAGTGSAHSAVGPSANRSTATPAGAATSTVTRAPSRFAARIANAPAPIVARRGTSASACASFVSLAPALPVSVNSALPSAGTQSFSQTA